MLRFWILDVRVGGDRQPLGRPGRELCDIAGARHRGLHVDDRRELRSGSETWQIYTEDLNTGSSATLTETLSGWGPFNQAYFGTLEVQGLKACDGLPAAIEEPFYMYGGIFQAADAAGGGPQAYVNVTSKQAWQAQTAGATNPNCLWGTFANLTGETSATLTWVY